MNVNHCFQTNEKNNTNKERAMMVMPDDDEGSNEDRSDIDDGDKRCNDGHVGMTTRVVVKMEATSMLMSHHDVVIYSHWWKLVVGKKG